MDQPDLDPRTGCLSRLEALLGRSVPVKPIPTVAPITERPVGFTTSELMLRCAYGCGATFGSVMGRALHEYTCTGKPKAAPVIDLRRNYEIAFSYRPDGQWEAVDRATFDHDPESRLHIYGIGKTTGEAVSNLLEALAAVAATSCCLKHRNCIAGRDHEGECDIDPDIHN